MLKIKLSQTGEGLISFLVPGTGWAPYISPWGSVNSLRTAAKVLGPHLSMVSPQWSAYNGPFFRAHFEYMGHFGFGHSSYRNLYCLSLNCKTFEAGENFLCIPSAVALGPI